MHKSFDLKQEKYLPDIDSTAYLLVHKKTKAEVLYLKNSDENKAFAISFKTISNNATGVAHILEHSVLCGSEKYPSKEPFAFLMKSSLATFLNASTYPDRTAYPVASTNEKDLENLSKVYLDTVFRPLLKETTFKQEGWHYELFSKEDPVIYKGVVFNEMKGSFSNIDNFMAYGFYKHIYAGSSFAHEFGGLPSEIPSLTYVDFKNFHQKYYHPSNSRTILYGDLEVNTFLNLLESYFDAYDFKETPDELIPIPASLPKTQVTESYPTTDENDTKSTFMLGFLFDHKKDVYDFFVMELLNYLLLKSESSALKKALLDSKLGESFFNFEYDPFTYYGVFAVGLKGISDPTTHTKIKEIILNELENYSKGIDRDVIEGAINKLEFLYRASSKDGDGKGLEIFALCNFFWNYGLDPLEVLDFTKYITFLRESCLNGNYLENYIKANFLNNQRQLSLSFLPESNLQSEQNQLEIEKLEKYKKGLTEAQLEDLIAQSNELKNLQEQADSEEVIQKLPALTMQDISTEVRAYPISTIPSAYDKAHVITTTKGVLEGYLLFDFSHLDQDLIPYLGLYKSIFLKVGTKSHSPQELATLLDINFGSISSSVFYDSHVETGNSIKKYVFGFKLLESNQDKAIALINELLLEVNISNSKKIKELIAERKNDLEVSMVEEGHRNTFNHALASFREPNWLYDQIAGVSAYEFYKELNAEEPSIDDVINKLQLIHTKLINTGNFSVVLGSSIEDKDMWSTKISSIYQVLPKGQKSEPKSYLLPKTSNTGFVIPSPVNFVGLGFDLDGEDIDLQGAIWPFRSIAKTNYLWNEVRVKGGAYGVFIGMYMDKKGFMVSYRDPNIEKTLASYKKLGEYISNTALSERDLEIIKIGSLTSVEPYYEQEDIVFASWRFLITGQTNEYKQKAKDLLLATTLKDIKKFGKAFSSIDKHPTAYTVLGNKEKLEQFGKFDAIKPLV